MSFYIWVTRRTNGEPDYGNAIYENGLASEDVGWEYFLNPAAELKLPLLARLREVKVEGAQLAQLAQELDTLAAWWVRQGHIVSDIGEYLKQRSGHLRAAIEVAQREDAVLHVV